MVTDVFDDRVPSSPARSRGRKRRQSIAGSTSLASFRSANAARSGELGMHRADVASRGGPLSSKHGVLKSFAKVPDTGFGGSEQHRATPAIAFGSSGEHMILEQSLQVLPEVLCGSRYPGGEMAEDVDEKPIHLDWELDRSGGGVWRYKRYTARWRRPAQSSKQLARFLLLRLVELGWHGTGCN